MHKSEHRRQKMPIENAYGRCRPGKNQLDGATDLDSKNLEISGVRTDGKDQRISNHPLCEQKKVTLLVKPKHPKKSQYCRETNLFMALYEFYLLSVGGLPMLEFLSLLFKIR